MIHNASQDNINGFYLSNQLDIEWGFDTSHPLDLNDPSFGFFC